jgi:uncharacterized protein (TIGR03437 family)
MLFRLSVQMLVLTASSVVTAGLCAAQSRPTIFETTLEEPNQTTPEISTDELQKILADGRVPVFDARSELEYAIAHIPGTTNLYEKEADRIQQLYPDRSTPVTLYCNGPFCGKSKRTAEDLAALGYNNIRRYQLGMPVWRALGNTVETTLAGMRYIIQADHTAILVDARSPEEFADTLPGARNIRAGEATAANDDGRLPLWDKGTRIVVFGSSVQQARKVAEEIAKKAYWNSSYFAGSYEDLKAPGLFATVFEVAGTVAGFVERIKPNGERSLEPTLQFDPTQQKYISAPIAAGTGDQMYLTLYGSGLRLRTMRDQVTVRIAGLDAPVVYAGPAPGLQPYDQVNVQLPASLGRGRIEVTVEVNGIPANTVSVVFQ